MKIEPHILELAFAHVTELACVFDPEGRFVYANASLLKVLQTTQEGIAGKKFSEIGHPGEFADQFELQLKEVIASGHVLNNEVPYLNVQGHPGYYEYSLIPEFDDDDGVKQVVGWARAVTEIRSADDAIRRLAAIVESSEDAIIGKDLNGRITSWNQGAVRLFGYSAREIIGKLLLVLIPPDRQGEEPKILERVRRGERIEHYETVRLRKDGTQIPVSLTVSPIKTELGTIIGISNITRDISDRRRSEAELHRTRQASEVAERALAESAERFRLLAEVVSLQVWTARPTGELDWANLECVNYLKADIERDILGNAWAQFVHADDLPHAMERWKESLATGARYEVEFRLRRHDGAYRWFLVRAQAMRDENGTIVHWFGTNTDTHDLKTAQREAMGANRAKDAFLAVLSHELRTPLTPVLMSAAALRDDTRLPEEVRQQLGMMERNIALEARLIDDLLDLTRIGRGQIQLLTQPCDAHSLIGLAVEIVRDDAMEKEIKLERDFTAHQSGLVADPARFQQVIWNLLRNAVKFTPRGGRILIRTADETGEQGGGVLHIEVCDSGIGIEPDALDKIFTPFEQLNHRMGGLGLGLAISRAIVDAHGGTISARSEGLNRGTTFAVDLPGATEPPPGVADGPDAYPELFPAKWTADRAGLTPVSSLKLLLVEDHESTLRVLSRLLMREGHHVAAVTTIAAALAVAETEPFDLVISDLGLPDGTGTELMGRLRASHGLKGIALSGYGMEEDLERSREAGFITHLTKPVDFQQLQRVLDEFSQSGNAAAVTEKHRGGA
ncbi:MAG: PAS domain S-box protein [Chthoniobacteraceae bacterium]